MQYDYVGELEHPPQVGKWYWVDCIEVTKKQVEISHGRLYRPLSMRNDGSEPVFMPILLPGHHDAEIGVPEPHYHNDTRFVRHESLFISVFCTPPTVFPERAWIQVPAIKLSRHLLECLFASPPHQASASALHKMYKDKEIEGHRCLHKGYDLRATPFDIRDGGLTDCKTCPMHKLKYDMKSKTCLGIEPHWVR